MASTSRLNNLTRRSLLLLSISGLLAADAPDNTSPVGKWVFISKETEGKADHFDEVKVSTFEITFDYKFKASSTVHGKVVGSLEGRCHWDPSTTPKEFEYSFDEGKYAGQHFIGIYKIEDEKLFICACGRKNDRPADFKTRPRSGHRLWIFSRAE